MNIEPCVSWVVRKVAGRELRKATEQSMTEVSGVGPPNELRREFVLRRIGSVVAFAIGAIWAGGAMATAVMVAVVALGLIAPVLLVRGRVGAAARLTVRWLGGLDLASARRLEADWVEAWAEADAGIAFG